MNDRLEFAAEQSGGDADLLTRLVQKADRILIKKLSNNDRDWAHNANKHQAGVYIPHEQRDSGFFPSLEVMERKDKDADEIRQRLITTSWPQVDDEQRQSRLVHYTSKGQETHLTRVPKAAFAELLPASYLVMGRSRAKNEYVYECLTIDSGGDEAILLRDLFDLPSDFLIGEFDPIAVKRRERERVLDFAEQVVAAWLAGKIAEFAADNACMPTTIELARLAQGNYLTKHSLKQIDPFALDMPGDALREISRGIEWDLFREYQRRERSVELVRLVLGDAPQSIDAKDIVRRLIDRFAEIDALMLSASQQRKSRAGYSYEHHIEAMLIGGRIPFEKQVLIESKKRPDFILPSLAFVDSGRKNAATGLILSAKTTLRERWKQVEREKGTRRLFLATVDENIAGNALEDMASLGINLVVPESLLESDKLNEYSAHKNVISFKQFCETVIKPQLAIWKA